MAAEPQLLAKLAAALRTARRPVFVAGGGVSRDGAYAALTRLAEVHEAPVWTAPRTARACGTDPVRRPSEGPPGPIQDDV